MKHHTILSGYMYPTLPMLYVTIPVSVVLYPHTTNGVCIHTILSGSVSHTSNDACNHTLVRGSVSHTSNIVCNHTLVMGSVPYQ